MGAGHGSSQAMASRQMFHWWIWSVERTSFPFLAEENLQTGQTHQCCDIVPEEGAIPKSKASSAAVLWRRHGRAQGASGAAVQPNPPFRCLSMGSNDVRSPLSGEGAIAPKSRHSTWSKSWMHNKDVVSVIVG